MALVDFALVKKHVNASDFTDDDDQLMAYQAAAETLITEYLDRVVYGADGSSPSGDDGTAIEIAPPITAAVLLLVEDMYENRGSGAWDSDVATLPRTVRALLAPYRVWRTLTEEELCADPLTTQ